MELSVLPSEVPRGGRALAWLATAMALLGWVCLAVAVFEMWGRPHSPTWRVAYFDWPFWGARAASFAGLVLAIAARMAGRRRWGWWLAAVLAGACLAAHALVWWQVVSGPTVSFI